MAKLQKISKGKSRLGVNNNALVHVDELNNIIDHINNLHGDTSTAEDFTVERFKTTNNQDGFHAIIVGNKISAGYEDSGYSNEWTVGEDNANLVLQGGRNSISNPDSYGAVLVKESPLIVEKSLSAGGGIIVQGPSSFYSSTTSHFYNDLNFNSNAKIVSQLKFQEGFNFGYGGIVLQKMSLTYSFDANASLSQIFTIPLHSKILGIEIYNSTEISPAAGGTALVATIENDTQTFISPAVLGFDLGRRSAVFLNPATISDFVNDYPVVTLNVNNADVATGDVIVSIFYYKSLETTL